MKRFGRFLLLVLALMVGGGLGSALLSGPEPVKIILFMVACLILGNIFYQIDKKISEK
ncbi:hypothetical protein [Flintibacter sp. KGMB00164]|uniref:hypothetical protein n=1 Tax=Flintibacter sp. KGMB00164 TaxID=2610895 RepID=UPI001786C074|nr:hypothetical protein [Flintibacter sp. KGMB00164]